MRLQSFVNILQSSTLNFKDYIDIQGVAGLSRKISPPRHIGGQIFLRYCRYTPVYIYTVKNEGVHTTLMVCYMGLWEC